MDTFKNLASVAEEDDDDEEDDEDYVPSKEDLENDDDHEKDIDDDDDESSNGSGESDDGNDGPAKQKRKKKVKRRGIKRKSLKDDDDAENVDQQGEDKKDLTIDEKKKKADDLWAELNDSSSIKSEPKPLSTPKETNEEAIAEKVYDFAGEKVVIKETPKPVTSSSSSLVAQSSAPPVPTIRRSGLKDFVSNLGKKNKIGTLQKSKIDWDSFKRDQGIEDDLKQATLSKDGYVERQAFLSRADVRQFEIEKSIRSKIRKPQ